MSSPFTNLGGPFFKSFLTNDSQTGYSDLFGRQTVAPPTTVFTTHVAFTPQNEIMGYVSTGTGTIVHDISQTLMKHTVLAAGDRAVRQSLEYLLYQPGKLQQTTLTATPDLSGTFDTSVVTRFGLFDDYRDKTIEVNQPSMGHFFEISGNLWFVVERANSYDNITNVTRVAQANWNLDTLNGNRSTSPSGYILSSAQRHPSLFIIDRQWLGVGIVRMGVIINGKPIYCHAFHGRNIGRPYTHLSKLPMRWEIEKVAGGANAPATMGSICGSSEMIGDYTTMGTIRAFPSSLAPGVTVDTTTRPVLLLRLQQRYCRATFKLLQLDLFSSSDSFYTVFKNPTITGTPSLSYTNMPDATSLLQYSYVATPTNYTVSGGQVIRSGYLSKTTAFSESVTADDLITAVSYCSNIQGNPDILVICIGAFSGNNTVHAVARWIEIV
jgi:hypothetical protein